MTLPYVCSCSALEHQSQVRDLREAPRGWSCTGLRACPPLWALHRVPTPPHQQPQQQQQQPNTRRRLRACWPTRDFLVLRILCTALPSPTLLPPVACTVSGLTLPLSTSTLLRYGISSSLLIIASQSWINYHINR